METSDDNDGKYATVPEEDDDDSAIMKSYTSCNLFNVRLG